MVTLQYKIADRMKISHTDTEAARGPCRVSYVHSYPTAADPWVSSSCVADCLNHFIQYRVHWSLSNQVVIGIVIYLLDQTQFSSITIDLWIGFITEKLYCYSMNRAIQWCTGAYLATHESRNFGGDLPKKGTTPNWNFKKWQILSNR